MPIKRPQKPVIRIERGQSAPRLWWLVIMLLPILLIGWLVYDFGTQQGGFQQALTIDNKSEVEKYLRKLEKDNKLLVEELAKAQRNSDIDSTASREVQRTLTDKENEIKALKEELSFYKSIVSPQGKEKGLNINSFTLQSSPSNPQLVKFKLVLTQTGNNNKAAKGMVLIRLQGKEGDSLKTLEWWDIRAESNVGRPSFDFKYFQRLEDNMLIPANFKPENILIKVLPESKRLSSIQQSYSWQAMVKR
ncbi:MAG TPA: hypothetical protein EYH06_10300 [Chromatiales bacterium]|nr:hypothetical protein [Thiotrichales bacterium]HIP68959.1 hypothetical protein [Chromatiales bacterium]